MLLGNSVILNFNEEIVLAKNVLQPSCVSFRARDVAFQHLLQYVATQTSTRCDDAFAVFNEEQQLRTRLGVPEHMQLLGAIAIGHPDRKSEKGRSAARPRMPVHEAMHQSRW